MAVFHQLWDITPFSKIQKLQQDECGYDSINKRTNKQANVLLELPNYDYVQKQIEQKEGRVYF
jgi:hypothetical protein